MYDIVYVSWIWYTLYSAINANKKLNIIVSIHIIIHMQYL